MVQPSAYEQYMLEMINRARLNPQAEADLYGIGLNDGLAANTISDDPKQPLVFNSLLINSARSHSQWMLDTDTFSHTGDGGTSSHQRMKNAGYQFTGSWRSGENLGYQGTTGTVNLTSFTEYIHQGLFESSGHRRNILQSDYREIGLGNLTGDFRGYNSLMVTQNFAESGSDVFLTGVAYDDLVIEDDFYTVGEGLAGIEIRAIDTSDNSVYITITMDEGGYQMALPAGTYDVSFYDNNQTIGNIRQITIDSENIKLDLDTSNLPLSSDFDTSNTIVRTNAGAGEYVDIFGQQWQASQGFSSGRTFSNTNAIAQTESDFLYQSEHIGRDFNYTQAVANGSYDVTLHFAEIFFNQSGKRVFDVSLEDQL
nr:malectin domain-containing carbohydrate-binding protein [Pleurocapsa sp. MO_226.B13]